MLSENQILLAEIAAMRAQLTELQKAVDANSKVLSLADQLDQLPNQVKGRQVRDLLGISGVTLWKWDKAKVLHPQIIRGRKYYKKSDVMALLNQRAKKVAR